MSRYREERHDGQLWSCTNLSSCDLLWFTNQVEDQKRETDEKTFQSTNKPSIYLNIDSGKKECDTRNEHATNTRVLQTKERYLRNNLGDLTEVAVYILLLQDRTLITTRTKTKSTRNMKLSLTISN